LPTVYLSFTTALADLADELEELVGYTIVASKTIASWYDDVERDDGSFNGCSHGQARKKTRLFSGICG